MASQEAALVKTPPPVINSQEPAVQPGESLEKSKKMYLYKTIISYFSEDIQHGRGQSLLPSLLPNLDVHKPVFQL